MACADGNHGAMRATRLVTLEDAEALAALLVTDRDFLAPWSPVRDDEHFTVEGQHEDLRTALKRHEQGSA